MEKNKVVSITGKEDKEVEAKDLNEVISGKKANKFSKYPTKEIYKKALYEMTHIELCDELMRLGHHASCEKEFCRNKCLALYEAAQKPRTVTYPAQKNVSLEDIIRENK